MSAERVPDVSTELDHILSTLGIGSKLKALRLNKKISLVDLGKHTGLSPSMLSQLENGKLIPTLPTLTRISMVFDVGLGHFFANTGQPKTFVVMRAAERLRFPENSESPNPSYHFECLAYSASEKAFHAYLADFPSREAFSESHSHDGYELVFVIRGKVEIEAGSRTFALDAGDSAYFDSSQPHGYRGVSGGLSQALVVCTVPPRS